MIIKLFFVTIVFALILGVNQINAVDPGGCNANPTCWKDDNCSGECWYFNCTSDICNNEPQINKDCGVCVTT